MALPPRNTEKTAEEAARKKNAEDEVLLREVDDALREDQFHDAASKYGKPALALLVIALATFGGYLFWQDRQEADAERQSEELVRALDQIDGGNLETGYNQLEGLAQYGTDGTGAAAQMLRAGIALENGRRAEAIEAFAALAADESAPQPYRDLALIRQVATGFEDMEPARVIEMLKPLATPGGPWFGSAGELVGMAYLKQDREDLAGPLFAEIAKDDDVPESLRSRARQLAGVLGYDAIEDVTEITGPTEEETEAGEGAGAPAPAAN